MMIWAAWLALAFVAFMDLIADSMGGSFFGGNFFKVFAIITVIGVIALIIYKAVTEQKTKKQKKVEVEKAAEFEPRREKEIKRILQKNPGFNTLCYECIHFNQKILHCGRDLEDLRIKEVSIGEKKYCLYWVKIPEQ